MLNNGLSFVILLVAISVIIITLYYLVITIKEIFEKQRFFNGQGIKGVFTLIMSLLLISGFGYCLYYMPYILFNGLSWAVIEEWGPFYLPYAIIALAIALPLFYLYFLLTYFYIKPDDKPYFMVIVLSMISGIGNSLIIFNINEALNRSFNEQSRFANIGNGLYLYFILGILLFTLGAMVVRKKLIIFTSNIVYEKRMEIINKILKAPFYKFEAIENEKAYAALNNDTETVSGFVNMFVNSLTGIITMVACFIYLGTLNLNGMIFSILIISLAVVFFLQASQSAEHLFEKNRDYQNIFFKNITDMVRGFKELSINREKKVEFHDDIQRNCQIYRDTRMAGEFKFVGVSVLGEIMYIAVIGVVVFAFPVIFSGIQNMTLRNYVVVYLYVGGIVNQLVFIVPSLIRVLISWKRINQFINEISTIGNKDREFTNGIESNEQLSIILKGVTFEYNNDQTDKFSVGPIDYEFKSGEIVFISGGNGSGKTTLAKLITGLYQPHSGKIVINGRISDPETLGNYFSTVFSDFYLFDKLYGIDHQQKGTEIQKYLEILRIQDKVRVNNGVFSTLKLSSGQRKRLALLISYLEDRPAYLFDEWAADQDPEFRKFFYTELLPDLKAKGKVIIAITHDDRYYGMADRLLKMETGKIVGQGETGFDEVAMTGV